MFVRPSGKSFGDFGVFEKIGENRAQEVFTGTKNECYEYIERTEKNEVGRFDGRKESRE